MSGNYDYLTMIKIYYLETELLLENSLYRNILSVFKKNNL